MSDIGHAGALLTVDLAALRANYRLLRETTGPAACAAVVKADGYGLGAVYVAQALQREGCQDFFVAHLQEAVALRAVLSQPARIMVLHGPTPGAEPDFVAHAITPVLNAPEQLSRWAEIGRPAWLQFDTGMTRFGLDPGEVLSALPLCGVMSHLACADTPAHPANAMQLRLFRDIAARFPGLPASLAASSGIFLGAAWHFDLVRPGAALYGVNPQPGQLNPMQPVVRLQGRVMQTRAVPAGTAIGYGLTRSTTRASRLATVAVGYADGFLRSSAGTAFWHGVRLPIMGRVSMDSIVLDVTDASLPPDALVDLIGPDHDVDAAADAAGTIGYEILTSLGSRYARHYIGA